jgi:hypothetical protein
MNYLQLHSIRPRHRDLRAFYMILIVAAMTISAAGQTYGPPSSYYVMKWSDNFMGSTGSMPTTIDPREWMWLMGVAGPGIQLAANVSQNGSGSMNIANLPQMIGSTSYTGGGLISQSTFRFGYFQVTAQTPTDMGWLTAFSLSGGASGVESWNRRALPENFTQIDAFKIDSTNPTQWDPDLISWKGSTGTTYTCTLSTPPPPPINSSTGAHTYGIEWTETAVNYYVDGNPLCSQTYSPTLSAASPVNLILSSIANDATITAPAGAQATFSNPQYYVQDYYVNPEDTGYAEYGSGWGNSSVAGFSSQPIRYSCSSTNAAIYTPGLLAAGNYEVWVYAIINSGTQDTATTVTINTSSGPQAAPTLPSTGASRWVDEGNFSFITGASSSVMLTRGNNCLRASMVKFVRSQS